MAPDENIAKVPFHAPASVGPHPGAEAYQPDAKQRHARIAGRRLVESILAEAGLRMTGPGLVGPGPDPGRSRCAYWSNQG